MPPGFHICSQSLFAKEIAALLNTGHSKKVQHAHPVKRLVGIIIRGGRADSAATAALLTACPPVLWLPVGRRAGGKVSSREAAATAAPLWFPPAGRRPGVAAAPVTCSVPAALHPAAVQIPAVT
jgi:hypothetical protein